MSRKSCDSFLCSNTCPSKYRYCYECAKRKGLIGNSGGGWGTIIFGIIILLLFF